MVEIEGINIEWLGHATFRFSAEGRVVYIDPYVLDSNPAKADLILITHEHYDHLDAGKVKELLKDNTIVVTTPGGKVKLARGLKADVRQIDTGQEMEFNGITVKAVPAYNIGKAFHPKEFGFGFVFTIAGKKIYHAGDTDKIPEMSNLRGQVDIALLPIGGTYTMDAKEAGEATDIIKPKIVIPMHYGSSAAISLPTNPQVFKDAITNKDIVVKVLG